MKKNLLLKAVLIVAVLIVFLFGIIGLPSSLSGQGLLASLKQRIHLGLDLKGGTHLILQVQVNDAINADTDRAVERLKDSLKSSNVAFGEIRKPDPQGSPKLSRSKVCRQRVQASCDGSSAKSCLITIWPRERRTLGR